MAKNVEKDKIVGGTKRMRCSCSNDYQDRRYGRGIRVHNKTAKKIRERPVYRCTSCTRERD